MRWTTEWLGREGDITPGTTILDGIKQAVGPGVRVQYNRFGRYDRILDENGAPAIADVGIAVVAERPYAEGVGDSADLALPDQDLSALKRLQARSKRRW